MPFCFRVFSATRPTPCFPVPWSRSCPSVRWSTFMRLTLQRCILAMLSRFTAPTARWSLIKCMKWTLTPAPLAPKVSRTKMPTGRLSTMPKPHLFPASSASLRFAPLPGLRRGVLHDAVRVACDHCRSGVAGRRIAFAGQKRILPCGQAGARMRERRPITPAGDEHGGKGVPSRKI